MNKKTLVLLALVLLLGAGCTKPSEGGLQGWKFGPQAWIDSPLDGSQFPPGIIHIVTHGSDVDQVTKTELIINEEIHSEGEFQENFISEEHFWDAQQVGEHTISYRVYGSGGWSSLKTVRITITGEKAGPTDTPQSEVSPSPEMDVTPAVIPSPTLGDSCAMDLILRAKQSLYCRRGTSKVFTASGILEIEQEAVVIALNPSQSWALIENPSYPEEGGCWVILERTEIIQGDPDCVEEIDDPPTPTPAASPTFDGTSYP